MSDLRVEGRTPRPPAGSLRAQLVVLAGEHVGRRRPLGPETILGRSNGVDFRLEDGQISRRHARIRRRGDSYVLEDLQSRNGTLVNGQRIQEPRRLAFGDRIQLGSRVVLLFCHHDPAEEALHHRQRLEALGRLGAGLAHDFNNLLGAIRSTLDFLEGLPDDRPLGEREVRESLRDVRLAADRAAELTHRVLGFARRRPPEMEPVDLSDLADEVVRLCRRTFPRSIRIFLVPEPGLRTMGDRSQLHQVLMNLCLNARDAMQGEGTLRLETGIATPEELVRAGLGPASRFARVVVSDDGAGMDEETRRHAFDPFFSTKPGNVGAGIGLASVYQAVRNHGGSCLIESTPGQGTRVTVLLPLCEQCIEPRRTEQPTTERLVLGRAPTELAEGGGRLLVLLVDDEEIVRRSTARLLRRSGYDVTFAKDGREALAIVRHAERRPDVVLMDLDMPVMQGEEAFERLRRSEPDLPVVFVSGYWDVEREQALRAAGAAGFLHKPFEAEELRLAILQATANRS